LLGYTKADNFIGESRLAFDAFMKKIQAALEEGKVRLTIRK
jgi:hypothetical protein